MNILQIFVYGIIGSYINAEGKKVKGIELEDIVAQVKSNPGFEEIHVKINSSGGNAQAGFDIYHYLKSLGKPITTMVDGKCESIATVIALAGDKRTITPDSVFMIHNPWAQPTGDADEIAAAAKELKAVEDQIINFYHEHTGIEKAALDAMMKKETEMNPTIAVNTKFMTEMVNKIEASAYSPDRKLNVIAVKKNPINEFVKTLTAFMNGEKTIFNNKHVIATLADGTQISIDAQNGVVAVGDEVTKEDQPMPDGTHKMLDGSSMTTVDGKITELTPKAEGSSHEDENKDDPKPTDPVAAAMLKKLELENAALKTSMENMNQNKTVANQGMLAMMKQLQIIGASVSSDYKPAADAPAFNKAGQGSGGGDSDNCVTGIKDREKEYKGYEKPE